MDTAFGWLGRFMEAISSIIPRLQIVPTTHGGVSFKGGTDVRVIEPGPYWYWPIWTDYIIIPTVRQTLNLPQQTLTTQDGHPITISAVIVYEVTDVKKALTVQWDLEDTLQDISQAAVREYTIPRTFEELRAGGNTELKEAIRKRLVRYGVGVREACVTDLAITRVITMIGEGQTYVEGDE